VPEPTGRYVDAGGVKLHYHEFGADRPGVPIVCLHGAGPGATAWSNFHGNIDALAGRSRTLLVDLPQFGRSEKVVIEGGRQSFSANVLAEFLKALAIPEADFVGNSMGGQVALRLAVDRPDLTHAIVAVGSTPATSVLAPWPAEGVKLINSYYKGAGPSIDKMRRVAEALVFDPSVITDELVRERYEASVDPATVELFTNHPPQREDFSARLGEVQAPVLLLWGQEDRAGAIDVALQLLRALQDAELHVFPRCGHWVQVERREEFNHLVLDFFARRSNWATRRPEHSPRPT
jgi:4,5:9,10-diseco-3-hydroxy-5,9,17-trioxoandrosta-1(10),2-diene-4-oate hydrolase